MNDTYAGIINGSGALTVGFSGTNANSLTLSGKNTYTGGTTVNNGGTFIVTGSIGGAVDNEGTFEVENSFGITDLTGSSTSAAIILGAGDILTISATHGTTADVYMGSISGTGGITLATGTMDFALTNGLTYTGVTTIDAGATMDINGQIVGSVINNGILNDQTSHTIGNLSGTGSIILSTLGGAPQFLTVIETGATTFTGPISGPGGFTVDSNGTAPGTLTLTGPLSYTGQTTIGSMATMILSGTNASSIGALDVMTGGTFALLPNVSITDLTGGGTVSIGAGDTLTSSPTTTDTFSGTIIGAARSRY